MYPVVIATWEHMTASTTLGSSEKQFNIIELLIQENGAGVTEIATELSIAKSTVHVHLQTLCEIGVVIQKDEEYHPSMELFKWGEQVRNNIPAYRNGRKEIDRLARETNDLVNFGIPENGKMRIIYLHDGTQLDEDSSTGAAESTQFTADPPKVKTIEEEHTHALGETLYMHASAMGKAVLSAFPEARVESIIKEQGLPAFTDNTITDRDELFDVFERIRSSGVARDREERTEGVRCVAAPIIREGTPIAAISVTGPVKRFQQENEDKIARNVLNTSNAIQAKLTYS
jgi:DNA-binding IclR family transcriptional regulator